MVPVLSSLTTPRPLLPGLVKDASGVTSTSIFQASGNSALTQGHELVCIYILLKVPSVLIIYINPLIMKFVTI